MRSGDRDGEVVQRDEGFWFHSARRRRQGRVCPYLGGGKGRLLQPGRRREGELRRRREPWQGSGRKFEDPLSGHSGCRSSRARLASRRVPVRDRFSTSVIYWVSHSNRSLAPPAFCGCSFLRDGERHSAVQRIPRSHSSASLRSRSALALSCSARASLRYRIARALLNGISNPNATERGFKYRKKDFVRRRPLARCAIEGIARHFKPARPGLTSGLPRVVGGYPALRLVCESRARPLASPSSSLT